MKHKVLDLFAGIGGFSLGLEATGGFETTAFCELDKKAQLVLKKHWPDVPIYEDIKELTYERLKADGNVPSVITGGFPCQDISCAGKAKGILAERSGLWSEMFRLIRDVRPAWAIIENVSALRSKGLTLVLQNLSEIGYMCEWHCIPASAVGAPHQRDRIWIIANPNNSGDRTSQRRDMPKIRKAILEGWQEHTLSEPSGYCEVENTVSKPARNKPRESSGQGWESTEAGSKSLRQEDRTAGSNRTRTTGKDVANPMQQHETQRGECEITESQGDGGGTEQGRSESDAERQRSLRGTGGDPCDEVANSNSKQLNSLFNGSSQEGSGETSPTGEVHSGNQGSNRPNNMVANPNSERLQGHSEELGGSCEVRTQETPCLLSGCRLSDFWAVESNVGRVAHGVPKRVDRLKQLGNSVVPQIPYLLGCAILSTETLDAEEDTNAHDSN